MDKQHYNAKLKYVFGLWDEITLKRESTFYKVKVSKITTLNWMH